MILILFTPGDPIDCIVEEIPNSVMDTYCWIHSTFRYICLQKLLEISKIHFLCLVCRQLLELTRQILLLLGCCPSHKWKRAKIWGHILFIFPIKVGAFFIVGISKTQGYDHSVARFITQIPQVLPVGLFYPLLPGHPLLYSKVSTKTTHLLLTILNRLVWALDKILHCPLS